MAFGQPPTTVSWRADKNKDTGEQTGWKLFGPTDLLQVGFVIVTKRDGSLQQVVVARVSKAFMVDGVECCYGWPAKNDEEGQAALNAQAARQANAVTPTADDAVDPWQRAVLAEPTTGSGGDFYAPGA